jgi:hypothetical protein
MKKIALAVTLAALAAPAFADTKADPFVSTQGGLGANAGIAAIGITAVGVIIAASDGS